MTGLLDHVGQRLARADVQAAPFPHLVVEDFLPLSLFSELLRDYPDQLGLTGAEQSSQGRLNLMYESPGFFGLMGKSPAWNLLYEFLRSQSYIQLLLQKFEQHLSTHGAVLQPEHDVRCKFDVAWAGNGYTRSCHLDRRNHAIASLFYFNSRADFGGNGGDLLLYKTTQKPPYDKFPAPESVEAACRIEAYPNRFVAFLNTSHAYHGIDPMRDNTGLRKFLYISVDNHSTEDMWPPVVADEGRRTSFLSE